MLLFDHGVQYDAWHQTTDDSNGRVRRGNLRSKGHPWWALRRSHGIFGRMEVLISISGFQESNSATRVFPKLDISGSYQGLSFSLADAVHGSPLFHLTFSRPLRPSQGRYIQGYIYAQKPSPSPFGVSNKNRKSSALHDLAECEFVKAITVVDTLIIFGLHT